jgi:AraC-like DNA-binding protein
MASVAAGTERRVLRMPARRAVYGAARAVPGVEFLSAEFSEHRFAPHVHPVFVVGTVRAGACRIWHRGASHVATVGDLILINPGDPHSAAPVGEGNWDYCAIYFGPPQLPAIAPDGDQVDAGVRLRSVVSRDEQLSSRLNALCTMLENDPDAPRAESAIVPLVRDLFQVFGERVPPGSVDAMPAAMSAVRSYIDAHFHKTVRIDTLAEIAGRSSFHVIRSFSRQFGMPPYTYLTHLRVARARELLQSGRPISDTALEVGFADQSHLTRFFRRIVGVPPGVFARAMARDAHGAPSPTPPMTERVRVPAGTEYVLGTDR